MKNIILIILLGWTVIGCSTEDTKDTNNLSTSTEINNNTLLTIDNNISTGALVGKILLPLEQDDPIQSVSLTGTNSQKFFISKDGVIKTKSSLKTSKSVILKTTRKEIIYKLKVKVIYASGKILFINIKIKVYFYITTNNQAPNVNAGKDKTIEVNTALTIKGTATDSDGIISSIKWKKGSEVLATTLEFSYIPTHIGTDTLTLFVTDNEGNISKDSMNVIVKAKSIVVIPDTTKPVITLLGIANITLIEGTAYTDAGATANDDKDGDITSNIRINNPVDINTVGTYTITYDVNDSSGNDAMQITRTVHVEAKFIIVIPDTTAPTKPTLTNTPTSTTENTQSIEVNGEVEATVWINGVQKGIIGTDGKTTISLDTSGANGVKTFSIVLKDASNNASEALVLNITKTTAVIPDTTKPVITLLGEASISIIEGTSYTDAGATANDNKDGDISSNIQVNNPLHINLVGTYVITYDVTDAAGNIATQVSRTVNVNRIPVPYDLDKFKSFLDKSNLQWQSKNGQYDIKSNLEGVSTSYFYLTDNKYMTFKIANAGQKRVELRQKETWVTSNNVKLSAKIKCYTPIALKEYTFTQLFNKTKNSPSVRLLWHKKRSGKSNHLWAFVKTDAGERKVDLGEKLDLVMDVNVSIVDFLLTVKVNNEVKLTQNIENDSYWDGDFYFKAGAYISGSINNDVPEGERGAKVEFESLTFDYNENIDIAHKHGKAIQGTAIGYQYYESASNVIDKNDSTFNHTRGNTLENWWQVELPPATLISKIMIKGRDSNTHRLNGAKVYITNSSYTGTLNESDLVDTLEGTANEQVTTFITPKSGTYLIVKGADNNHLHLATVEVYGQVPQTPSFNAHESEYLIQGRTAIGTVVTTITANDFQEDTLTYSIVAEVPFTINAQGEVSVNANLSESTYTFDLQVSDGINNVTTSITVNITSSTVITDVLVSGDVINTKVTEEELIQATLDEIEASKTFLQDAKVKIFNLEDDGTAKEDGSSLTSIDWTPTHDASMFLSTLGQNSAFLHTNAVESESYTVYKKEIAILGAKGNGHYMVFGSNPFRNGINEQMNSVLKNSLSWLTGRDNLNTLPFNIVIAHLDDSHYFRDESKTRAWLDANYAGQVQYNSANSCDNTALSSCLNASTDLLIISQVSVSSDNVSNIATAVNTALSNGTPVLYIHHDGNLKSLGKELFSSVFDVTYQGDNYWKRLKVEAYNPTTKMNVLPENLQKIKTMFTHFKNKDYAFDWTACKDSDGNMGENNDKCNDVVGLSSEFQEGASEVRNILNSLDNAKNNVFSKDGYKFQKLLALTADKFRQGVVYPMDKVTSNDNAFMKSYYSDHAIYNYRTINPVQPNMGNFSRSDFSHITPVTKTVNLTSKKSFRSTGVYALPGQTFKITRNDSSDLTVKVFINTLRSGATHQYQKNAYNRPKYLQTPYFEIKKDESIELTSPYGGTVQLSFDKNDLPVQVTFENVGEHPYWASTSDNASFAEKMSASEYDWAEVATAGFEVHSKLDKMKASIADPKWGSAEALAAGVNKYTSNYPHVLAGFQGDGVDVVAEIHDWSTTKGLTIETIDTMKHMNADQATCGYGCSGNPYDAYWAFDPIGHGDIHEMGHSMQKMRFEGFPNHAATNTFSYYTKSKYFENTTGDNSCGGQPFKNVFNTVQASVGESNIPEYLKTNLWDIAGLGEQYLLKIQAMMHAQKAGKLTDGWHVLARVHILEREMSRAKADWDAKKVSVGFSTYTLDEINAIRDNDWLIVAYSYASELDLRNYFNMMGIPHSDKAYAQIATFGFDVAPNSLFVSTDTGYCNTDDYGTLFARPTLPIDGTTEYSY